MTIAQFYLPHIKQEQDAFRQVLTTYFFNGQYKNSRILDICCGVVNEESLLFDYFGIDSELVSIDNDRTLEELLIELGRKSVIIGDIRELNKYVSGKFQLIIGRNIPLNPKHNHYEKEIFDYWPEIFDNLTHFMENDSTLFLTLAREDEFYRAEEILSKLRYHIKIKEKNQIVVPSDHIGVVGADIKDNYVISAQPPLQLRLF
jgi:hypothetical protein